MANYIHFQAIIFDFDGTLAKTPLDFSLMRQKAREAIISVFSQKNSSALFTCQTFFSNTKDSIPLMEEINILCSLLSPADAARAHKAAYVSIKQTEIEAANNAIIFPDIRKGLRAGANKNIKFAIITRNCNEAIATVFPDRSTFIPHLFTRDHVSQVKPHPEHLLTALSALNCSPDKALMVGDHPMDIRVGKTVGTSTAGVLTGEGSRLTLLQEDPDFLEPNVPSLLRLLGIYF